MEKAAIYLRLSKEDVEKGEKENSRSIENQRAILEEYAKANHFQIFEYYIDDDYSGLYFERPAFSKMLSDAARHEFTVVLAKSQSRLSRNMEHTEYLLHKLFPQLGIRFLGVVDGVDSAQKAGKKARQINALVNEWYSEDLSENIRAVYQKKMQKGEYLGAYAPYGYQKSKEDSHKLEIVEKEAYWVRKAYEMYLQGYSIREVQQELIKNKVETPSAKRKEKPDCQWSVSTMKKILSNEVYIGTIVQGKSKRQSFKDKKIVSCPRESWIAVEGMHEPIIERELFERVRLLRESRTKRKKSKL
ncbi:MAG: recombinase family protein [Lachnospiraceae bacterium]|nr:recombinase family protein [Lachnospiraceae bacterium]